MNYPENELTLNSLCCSSCRVITNPFCSTQWLTHSTVPEGAKSFFIRYCLLNDIASSFPCRTIRGRRSRIISTVVRSRFLWSSTMLFRTSCEGPAFKNHTRSAWLYRAAQTATNALRNSDGIIKAERDDEGRLALPLFVPFLVNLVMRHMI